MKEGERISEALLSSVKSGTENLVQALVTNIHAALLQQGPAQGIPVNITNQIFQGGLLNMNDLFRSVSTTHERGVFAQQLGAKVRTSSFFTCYLLHPPLKFFPQDPMEVFMGNRVFQDLQGIFGNDACHGYCIPMQDTLTRIVKNPQFLWHICNPNASQDGILRDDIDGSNTRNHPMFLAAPDALRIRLYYDDVTLTDPIGSYKCNLGESLPRSPF
jgi:hypothetical protein